MKKQDVRVGLEVVRSKGDYVVGRTGCIVNFDLSENRAQVGWFGETTTWVSFDSIEPTSIPYEIIISTTRNKKTGRCPFPKYRTALMA